MASPAARADPGRPGFPPMSDPPAVALVAAVRAFALATAGLPPRRLVVTLADHSRLAIDIPAGPALPAAVATAPPPAGWSVRDRRVYHAGRVVEVPHQAGRVLRALAGAARPLSWEELRNAAWEDPRTEKATVENAVCKLRKLLRDLFGLDEGTDPVPMTIDGYSLRPLSGG